MTSSSPLLPFARRKAYISVSGAPVNESTSSFIYRSRTPRKYSVTVTTHSLTWLALLICFLRPANAMVVAVAADLRQWCSRWNTTQKKNINKQSHINEATKKNTYTIILTPEKVQISGIHQQLLIVFAGFIFSKRFSLFPTVQFSFVSKVCNRSEVTGPHCSAESERFEWWDSLQSIVDTGISLYPQGFNPPFSERGRAAEEKKQPFPSDYWRKKIFSVNTDKAKFPASNPSHFHSQPNESRSFCTWMDPKNKTLLFFITRLKKK